MEQYKIRPEGIRQIRNQSLRQSVPLTLLAVATGCFLSYPNFNSTVMMLFIPLMVGVVSLVSIKEPHGLSSSLAVIR
jgi:diacylglycerol kinase